MKRNTSLTREERRYWRREAAKGAVALLGAILLSAGAEPLAELILRGVGAA